MPWSLVKRAPRKTWTTPRKKMDFLGTSTGSLKPTLTLKEPRLPTLQAPSQCRYASSTSIKIGCAFKNVVEGFTHLIVGKVPFPLDSKRILKHT